MAVDDKYDDAYDRQGNRITIEEWGQLRKDRANIVVEQTQVGVFFVSTVWLGLNHSFGDEPPVIFETMVFEQGDDNWVGLRTMTDRDFSPWNELKVRLYSTEDDARRGHAAIVAELQNHVADKAD